MSRIVGGNKEDARIYCACALYFHSTDKQQILTPICTSQQLKTIHIRQSVEFSGYSRRTYMHSVWEVSPRINCKCWDHNAVCLLWHFFGMKTILDWKDCKKFGLKLLYTGCFFLIVPPHFLYQNEKTCSANEGFFLEKAVLVGCNLFFILVLKIGRTS